MEDGGLSAAQQQLDELECKLSMFPDAEEVTVDTVAKEAVETFVAERDGMPRPTCRMQFTLHYKVIGAFSKRN